ncbi:MAG TPA: Gfo/Idh/MocA family oxidoreductase [Armatimonadota bacterium]|nr:Gfo/Idh/MocA family oxidoreductase [Armatimonadota bacterium]
MSSIGVAILGFAHGHGGAYLNRMKTFDDVRLVAGWDHDADRGKAGANQFGLEFEPHLEHLLARNDIDAVIVTCETNRHAGVVEAAAAAGKHILLQKPMATTLADCDRIIEAVDRSRITLQMAFQMRCDPSNQKMKELIDDGTLGKIGMMRRRHCINFLFNPDLPRSSAAWHIDPVANVGMFFDDAVHAADLLYWFLGKPVSVMAEIDNILTNIAPDDTGIAIYRFEGGAAAVLMNASVTLAGENTTEIYGDQGVLIQNWDDGVSTGFAPPGAAPLKLYRKGQPARWEEIALPIPAGHGERIAAVPRPWIDQLKAGAPPTVNARDGKVSVEMCLAAYTSAREGRRIHV